MQRREFERLVVEALAELPGRYRDLLSNIVIIVEDYSPDRALAPRLVNAKGGPDDNAAARVQQRRMCYCVTW